MIFLCIRKDIFTWSDYKHETIPSTLANLFHTENNYWDLLTIGKDLLKEDGVLDYVVDTVTIDAKWDQVFNDLDIFLNQDFIKDTDPLWSTTAQLLLDLTTAMDESQESYLFADYF